MLPHRTRCSLPRPRLVGRPAAALALPLLLAAVNASAQETPARRAPTSLIGAAFSSDGRLAATLDTTGRIHVRDVRRERVVRIIASGFRRPITSWAFGAPLAFSPDGRLLAAGGNDGRVRLWDLATGRLRLTLDQSVGGTVKLRTDSTGVVQRVKVINDHSITGVAFRRDGAVLASIASDGSIVVSSVYGAPRSEYWVRQSCFSYGLDFSDDGSTVAIACGRGELLSLNTGKHHVVEGPADIAWDSTADEATNARRSCTASAVRFSPGGGLLAVLCAASGELRTYAVASRERVWTGVLSTRPSFVGSNALAFSADGRRVAAATNTGAVGVWNATDGDLREARRAAARPIVALWLAGGARRALVLAKYDVAVRTRTLDGR